MANDLITLGLDIRATKARMDKQLDQIINTLNNKEVAIKVKYNTDGASSELKRQSEAWQKAFQNSVGKTNLDTKPLEKYYKQIQKQKDAFNKSNINGIDYEIKRREFAATQYSKQLKAQLAQAVAAEKQIAAARKQSIAQDTLSTNVKKAQQELLNLKGSFTSISNNPDVSARWQELFDSSKIIKSKDELQNLRAKMALFKKEIGATGNVLGQSTSKIIASLAAMATFRLVVNGIKEIIASVSELDKSLTELNKVADLSKQELQSFTKTAFNVASEVGRTGQEVIDATTEFKRAGYELNESLEMAKSALLMTNIGDGINNVESASSALIAVLRGFNMTANETLDIVSKINQVSNTSPINFDDITEGLTRISGTMAQSGVSIDETIALLTGGYAQLRDIEKVSSGLIQISQRLRGIDADGSNIEGLTAKLQNAFKENANINIEDSNGNLRSTYDILRDLAGAWGTLTDKQRQYLGEEAAGNRQVTVLNAIMQQWQDVGNAVEQSKNSVGSAVKENEIYKESIAGIKKELGSAWAEFSNGIISSDAIKVTLKGVTAIVNLLTKAVDSPTLSAAFAFFTGTKLIKGFGKIKSLITSFGKDYKSVISSFVSNSASVEESIDGVAKGAEKGAKSLGSWQKSLTTSAAVIAAAVAIDLIIKAIDNYINRVEIAKEETEKAFSVWEDDAKAIEDIGTELNNVSARLEELFALQRSGQWNDALQQELITLQLQNAELQTRASLLRATEIKNRLTAFDALKHEVALTQSAGTYTSPYFKAQGLAADSGNGSAGFANLISEDQYITESKKRLNELSELKKTNGKLTAEELTEYQTISATIAEIGMNYSKWAEQADSIGNKDFARQYQIMAESLANSIDSTLYLEQLAVTFSDKLKQSLGDNEGLGLVAGELRHANAQEFLADSNKESDAYRAVAAVAKEYGIEVESVCNWLSELGYFQGEALGGATESFADLKSVLGAVKNEIDPTASSLDKLKSAIGIATDWRSTTQEVSNALRTIQQLTGVKLDIKADGLQDTLQLIKAYIDGDIESFNEMASAAMKSLGVKVDPSNIKAAITQLITMLGTLTGEAQSTATALISIFSSVGAVKKVIDKDKLNADIKSGAYKGGSSQGILDKYYKYVVDDSFFNQVNNTSTSSSGSSSTDPRAEAYEASLAQLGHLRNIDILSEQEYCEGMLEAFNRYLKDKTKYQSQWWAYQEAYYNWRKQAAEEAAEAEKDLAKQNYEAQKKVYEQQKQLYQKELDAIKENIEAKKKLLNREDDERTHQENVQDINNEIADYDAKIQTLMLDNSAKAKAKRLELEEKKQSALKKLADEQNNWSKQVQENALDDQMGQWEDYYSGLIELVNNSLDRIAESYDKLVASIEASLKSAVSGLNVNIEGNNGGFQYDYNKGGSKASIKETQESLVAAGYSVGSAGADGIWGARTEKAFIMAWQRFLISLGADIEPDGIRGSKTKAAESKLGVVFGQRYHTGGVVGKDITSDYRTISSLKPDEVPIIAKAGEIVLTPEKAALLARIVDQNKIVANAFKAFLPTARQPAMAGEAPQLSYSAVFHVNGDVDDSTVRKLDKVARTAAQEVYSNAIKGLQKTGRL